MAIQKPSTLFFFVTHARNHIKSFRGIRTKTSEKVEHKEPKPNQNEKLVKVAIIGTPNAGKSTFINSLVNHRVSEGRSNYIFKCSVGIDPRLRHHNNRFVRHRQKFTLREHLPRR